MNTRKRVNEEIDHFTNLSHVWWGARTPAGQVRYDIKALTYKKFCKPKVNSRILEIGCGDGEFTKRIAQMGGKIIATDVTPELLRRANKDNVFKNVTYKRENAEKLTFSNRSFDLVCGISILHHIDSTRALNEAYRVLSKGGKVFFTEPNLLNPNIFIGQNIPFLREKMEYSPSETALVRFKVEEVLKSIGFKKVAVRNFDFLHPLTPTWAIEYVKRLGYVLERTPLIKEISGSLLIFAEK